MVCFFALYPRRCKYIHVVRTKRLLSCCVYICDGITALLFLEQVYLLFWPEEGTYSDVAPSKLVEPKKPSVGDEVKVKDGTKVHTGEVVGVGSKAEMEKLLIELVRQNQGNCHRK